MCPDLRFRDGSLPAGAGFDVLAQAQALGRVSTRGRRGRRRRGRRRGVSVLPGTGALGPGTAHGASLHRALERLVASGLHPVEALAAATSTPARVFDGVVAWALRCLRDTGAPNRRRSAVTSPQKTRAGQK
ncbi:hypothetical protein tb265_41050 [Gemmatimonadetes bacterium T265]|nr:hypothetical protein tb265_41050 [Gemmatimonadetes bacterium T265]